MGRVLQLLVVCVVVLEPTYSFQQLLGVRDQARALIRLGGNYVQGDFLEQDMQAMFWEIPKEEALQAVQWAIDLAHPNKKHDAAMFAVCKDGPKHLDRLGTRSSAHFHNICGSEVLRYIVFEL